MGRRTTISPVKWDPAIVRYRTYQVDANDVYHYAITTLLTLLYYFSAAPQVFVFGPDKRIWELDKSLATAGAVLGRSCMQSFYQGVVLHDQRKRRLAGGDGSLTTAWVNGQEVRPFCRLTNPPDKVGNGSTARSTTRGIEEVHRTLFTFASYSGVFARCAITCTVEEGCALWGRKRNHRLGQRSRGLSVEKIPATAVRRGVGVCMFVENAPSLSTTDLL